MAENLTITEETRGVWALFCAAGRIDTVTAPEAETRLMAALEANEKMALSLAQLDYISSAGLRVLLRLAKKADAAGKDFVLVGADGMVREVLEESGMDALFTMYKTAGALE